MGCAQSSNAAAGNDSADGAAKQRSDEIEKQLRRERSQKRSEVRHCNCLLCDAHADRPARRSSCCSWVLEVSGSGFLTLIKGG